MTAAEIVRDRLIDPDLFHRPAAPARPDPASVLPVLPVLAGSRCPADATVTFPAQDTCPRCGQAMSRIALPVQGRLWSWTVQQIRPKPPFHPQDGPFDAFAVGYVDLGEVIVESRLDAEPDALWIGMPVRLCWLPLWQDADERVLGYAFAPSDRSPT